MSTISEQDWVLFRKLTMVAGQDHLSSLKFPLVIKASGQQAMCDGSIGLVETNPVTQDGTITNTQHMPECGSYLFAAFRSQGQERTLVAVACFLTLMDTSDLGFGICLGLLLLAIFAAGLVSILMS